MNGNTAQRARDPLELRRRPERLNYATGMMLDAEDFRDEQSYHRMRLARVLRYGLGMGTLAGLRVVPPKEGDPGFADLTLYVEPGIAIDRIGRLVEVGARSCIRLRRWFETEDKEALRAAISGGAVVADVFLSAHSCERAKTPAFATGPFDALDAVVPARIEDCFELKLVSRKETTAPVPKNFWPTTAEDRLDAVMGSWSEGGDSIGALQEHVADDDPTAVLLARVRIPADDVAGERPRLREAQPVDVNNTIRPFIFMPGKWLGEPFVRPI